MIQSAQPSSAHWPPLHRLLRDYMFRHFKKRSYPLPRLFWLEIVIDCCPCLCPSSASLFVSCHLIYLISHRQQHSNLMTRSSNTLRSFQDSHSYINTMRKKLLNKFSVVRRNIPPSFITFPMPLKAAPVLSFLTLISCLMSTFRISHAK